MMATFDGEQILKQIYALLDADSDIISPVKGALVTPIQSLTEQRLRLARSQKDWTVMAQLAEEVIRTPDNVVQDLIDMLPLRNAVLAADAMKVIEEVAMRAPTLVIDHIGEIARCLEKPSGRLFWLAAATIAILAEHDPHTAHAYLPQMLAAADAESVIARDATVRSLCHIARVPAYEQECERHLLTIMRTAPVNQFPSYAEQSFELLHRRNPRALQKMIATRLPEMNTSAKIKRLERLLQRLTAPQS